MSEDSVNRETLNPYAAPQAPSAAEEAVLAVDPTGGLRRRSIWLMILLSILHGFWTFVFGCLYLQWKVNRLLESGEFGKTVVLPNAKATEGAERGI